jgi:hypothetical protein
LFKQLQKGWILRPATESDLKTFNTYYEEQSGGLLLEALGVAKTNFDYGFMETLYKMNSLSRKLRIYALCFYDEVYAILFMEQSNPGLNFSDLLNNIKTLIIKPEKLPWKILSNAIAQLISKYKMGFIPILIYPIEYVKMNNIPNNKQYQLWICHIEHYYRIAEYLQAKFKLTYWN